MVASERLSRLASTLSPTMSVQQPDQIPWDPNCDHFPSRKDLPKIPGAPDGAAWVWGKDDSVCLDYLSIMHV